MKTSHRCAFSRIELVCALAVSGTLCTLLLTACNQDAAARKAAMMMQLNNAKQIAVMLKLYASDNDGAFPAYGDPKDPTTIFKSSNAALESLLREYRTPKVLFFNKSSAWCKKRNETAESVSKLLPGECEWAYVRGLSDTVPSNWPILADAFAPGTKTYVTDFAKQGGVWDGREAVVAYTDCSVRIVPTKQKDGTSYIPRADKPEANAFDTEKDEWLSGDKVEVLLPLPPNN